MEKNIPIIDYSKFNYVLMGYDARGKTNIYSRPHLTLTNAFKNILQYCIHPHIESTCLLKQPAESQIFVFPAALSKAPPVCRPHFRLQRSEDTNGL